METAGEVAKKLLQINAIKLNPDNPFTWASGLKSPIYCDNRISLSYPKTRKFILSEMVKLARTFEHFDVIAGVATAGIAHGALLAHSMDKPFVYVRSKAKAHGRQNQIEGFLEPNLKVLVVEDLISTGMSSLQAVKALRDAEAKVVGVVAIFNYEFDKAFKAFQKAKCEFSTLSNYSELLKQAIEHQYINDQQKELLSSWNVDPEAWSKMINKET